MSFPTSLAPNQLISDPTSTVSAGLVIVSVPVPLMMTCGARRTLPLIRRSPLKAFIVAPAGSTIESVRKAVPVTVTFAYGSAGIAWFWPPNWVVAMLKLPLTTSVLSTSRSAPLRSLPATVKTGPCARMALPESPEVALPRTSESWTTRLAPKLLIVLGAPSSR